MELKRGLGLIDVFSIASGAMISSGLFILPGIAYARAGPSMIVSYIIAGLFALTGVLSQAEIVSAMPKAGGTYFYVKRALGPGAGTVEGLLTWFSLSLKSAFALVGMAAFTSIFIDVDMRIIAVVLTAVFVLINLAGSKEAGRVQIVLCFFLFSALLFYIIRGFPFVSAELMHPFNPGGWVPTLTTAGFIFVSFGGLLKVASIAEEVRDPGKVIPLGMILSLITVSLLYFLTVFVTVGVLKSDLLASSLTPISDGAEVFMGNSGRIVMGIAAILAFISTANAGIMASSRYPMALSRDRLLPEALSRVGKKTGTPHIAILITGSIMVCFIFLRIDLLVKAASAVLIMTYMLSCLSLIILRESRLQNYQPVFHSPLYPWIQIGGIVGFIFMLIGIGGSALLTSGSIMVCGLFVYWFYGRIRAVREYALLHLIERITARELTTRTLETELKEIIRERDDITRDRLDRIIENAIVLDIEEKMDLETFFSIVADFLAVRLDVEKEAFIEKMRERERESSTVLTPLLAIPHIILEGTGKFDILLARCRGGVAFTETEKNVKSIFVLTGTGDERNFHLRALAGIAQIVQDPQFEENWLNARDGEGLRDLILLGKRKR
ncbi:MAG: amino acid permease [Candidatus Krumholzibacteriota bacterium]|nr:amino acid permease [Candidatus Krumholzibacteriota bacterium]